MFTAALMYLVIGVRGGGTLRERRDMLCNPHGELLSLWIDGIDLVNYLLNTVCVVTRVHNLTNKFELPL